MVKEMKIWERKIGYDDKAFPDLNMNLLYLSLIIFIILLFIGLLSKNYLNVIYDMLVLILIISVIIRGSKAREYVYQIQNNGRKYNWIEIKKQGPDGTYKLSKDKPMED